MTIDTDLAANDPVYEHHSGLFTYEAVVGLRPRSRRPIRRTHYHAHCSCGWSVDARDYIGAATAWRKHRAKDGAA